jgi:alkaline phosphatase D
VASGQPRPDSLVLWTRLTGPALPAQVPVRWQLAEDEACTRIAACGTELARAEFAHSVHAEPAALQPDRWYWYRFQALGQQSQVARTRTAPAPDATRQTLHFAIASCQRWDHGHYAAWRHAAADGLDLMLFLGDYIYESGSRAGALRLHEGGAVSTLNGYRARYAQYKSDPALQAAHAAMPWVIVWDDHEVDNDYASLQGQGLQADFAAQRAAAYQAWWEHMPVAKAAQPVGPDMRIYQRFDWGALARLHTLDNRQHRDAQACQAPGLGGSRMQRIGDCAQLRDPKRTLLGAPQEAWLADGWDRQRPWNLLAQQTLMTRFYWSDPAGDAAVWTDGWEGYAPARQRLLQQVAENKLGGVVVLGGDVHANYVADLLADFDDPQSAVVASEFCGTSISSLSQPQWRTSAALAFNPHVKYGRSDRRGYVRFTLDAQQLRAQLRVLDDARDAASEMHTAARFVVQAGRPGALAE